MEELESSQEINRNIDRLLREANARYRFPTPVEDIVATQKLSIAKFDDSPFAQSILIAAPRAIKESMRAFQFKMLAMLDRTERIVHLRSDGLEVQNRFSTCHEVGHDLCPWHSELYYVDSREQLSPNVRSLFEREANYAAAGLIFQQDVFPKLARSYHPGFDAIIKLAELFGGSIHAAFRLYIESGHQTVAGIVLLRSPSGTDATNYQFHVKSVFASPSFSQEYPMFDEPPRQLSSQKYPELAIAWDTLRLADHPSTGQIKMTSRDEQNHNLSFELFSNSYNLFLLVWKPRRRLNFL
jgi:Zn-dependent peptidase ImmA (M78 family)